MSQHWKVVLDEVMNSPCTHGYLKEWLREAMDRKDPVDVCCDADLMARILNARANEALRWTDGTLDAEPTDSER